MAKRLASFSHLLRSDLRGNEDDAWQEWVAPDEVARIAEARNRPSTLIQVQLEELAGQMRAGQLERFPGGLNREGFPNQAGDDSSWLPAKGAGMHGSSAVM